MRHRKHENDFIAQRQRRKRSELAQRIARRFDHRGVKPRIKGFAHSSRQFSEGVAVEANDQWFRCIDFGRTLRLALRHRRFVDVKVGGVVPTNHGNHGSTLRALHRRDDIGQSGRAMAISRQRLVCSEREQRGGGRSDGRRRGHNGIGLGIGLGIGASVSRWPRLLMTT